MKRLISLANPRFQPDSFFNVNCIAQERFSGFTDVNVNHTATALFLTCKWDISEGTNARESHSSDIGLCSNHGR